MVSTFLKVHTELGSCFCFCKNLKDIIIITTVYCASVKLFEPQVVIVDV
jgi:hypothetical protein